MGPEVGQEHLSFLRGARRARWMPGRSAPPRGPSTTSDVVAPAPACSHTWAMETVGHLIKHWRGVRRKSQLALAVQAGVSARHVGFIEVGRAAPSREMVLLLAGVLDVPLRERNALLLAAGYAPVYRETGLEAPEMEQARQAVAL